MDLQQSPFIRELASSERKTRDKAVESLTAFLRSKRDLKLFDLLKIWKGLFYCFYHSDKPLVQQALARSLSYTLVPSLPEQMVLPFLRAFWITMSRDFHSLDRLRLDKYLFLIRCYVGVSFEYYLKRGGKSKRQSGNNSTESQKAKNKRKRERDEADSEVNGGSTSRRKTSSTSAVPVREEDEWAELEAYLDMLEDGPLSPLIFDPNPSKQLSNQEDENGALIKVPKGPDGIRYHLMDIWLDELEKCATEPDESSAGDDEESPATKLKEGVPMELLLRPIERLQSESSNKTVRTRAKETLADERLISWGVREPEKVEEGSDEEDEWGGIED
ncbi:Ribosomal RNA-processing protein 1 [Trichophyton interdigitale]|nr:Ribosomal RNA-processing protein 1 [Trichophyton interdigitale]KAG5216680.1 Ribosomal RNA-processing protein 1 [Trichophyton interdigitale]KAG8205417.1 Ribosomal RNA-processing protein 1 [Trichophyton interdigitale]